MSASPLIQYSVNQGAIIALANGASAFITSGTLLALSPQSVAGITSITYSFSAPGTRLDGVILAASSSPWSAEIWLPQGSAVVTLTTQVNGLASATNTLSLSPIITDQYKNVFNVAGSFGGTPGTDVTNSLVTAFGAKDAAGGGLVYIPPTSYLSKSVDLGTVPAVLKGESGGFSVPSATVYGTVLTYTGTGSFLTVANVPYSAQGFGVRDLALAGSGVGTALDLASTNHPGTFLSLTEVLLDRLFVSNFAKGIEYGLTESSYTGPVIIRGCTAVGLSMVGNSTVSPTNGIIPWLDISNCANSGTAIAWDYSSGQVMAVTGGVIQGNDNGVKVHATAAASLPVHTTIEHMWFEANTGYDLQFDTTVAPIEYFHVGHSHFSNVNAPAQGGIKFTGAGAHPLNLSMTHCDARGYNVTPPSWVSGTLIDCSFSQWTDNGGYVYINCQGIDSSGSAFLSRFPFCEFGPGTHAASGAVRLASGASSGVYAAGPGGDVALVECDSLGEAIYGNANATLAQVRTKGGLFRTIGQISGTAGTANKNYPDTFAVTTTLNTATSTLDSKFDPSALTGGGHAGYVECVWSVRDGSNPPKIYTGITGFHALAGASGPWTTSTPTTATKNDASGATLNSATCLPSASGAFGNTVLMTCTPPGAYSGTLTWSARFQVGDV